MQDLANAEKIVPVLCIDEFEGFFNTPGRRQQFDMDFFRSLRLMANEQHLVLIVVSQASLRKIVGKIGRTSGFFNVFDPIEVRPFTLQEAQNFIETKGNQADFSFLEKDRMLKYGREGRIFKQYWPLRLELVGEMLLTDKEMGSDHYRPLEREYWKEFKKVLEQRYGNVRGKS